MPDTDAESVNLSDTTELPNFGEMIELWRTVAGDSQEKLATILQIPVSDLKKIEMSPVAISPELVEKIAKHYETDPDLFDCKKIIPDLHSGLSTKISSDLTGLMKSAISLLQRRKKKREDESKE